MTENPIMQYAKEFDDLCNHRMQVGNEKYGDFTWLEAPTFDMMLEEMADWVNYIRFTAIKLRLMQMAIGDHVQETGFMPSNPEKE